MFFVALQPGLNPQGQLTVTGSAQTSQQCGWQGPAASPSYEELFLVQALNGSVTVTIDGSTVPVNNSVGFIISQYQPIVMTRSELLKAKWISAGSVKVNIQGCAKPALVTPAYI